MDKGYFDDSSFDSLAQDWKSMAGKTLSALKEEILANQIPELNQHQNVFFAGDRQL